MILTSFGKEFIIINEELVIYISFLTVLTILINSFGAQISSQFADQANQVANGYSQGLQQKLVFLKKNLIANYKSVNFIIYLLQIEIATINKAFNLKNSVVKSVIANAK